MIGNRYTRRNRNHRTAIMIPSLPRAGRGSTEVPSIAELLVQGGDGRIQLDPLRGVNQYGCPIAPDPALLAFGSSTASVISAGAWAALVEPHDRLRQALAAAPPGEVHQREMLAIRHTLCRWCGLAEAAVDVVFAASGTDIHLIVGQLCRAAGPVRAIMVEPSETGSGVPAAVSGHHFGQRTALGTSVKPGSDVAADTAVDVSAVAVRQADGGLRPAEEIDADFAHQVAAAIAAGQSALLIQIAPSKTGIVAPSHAMVAHLQQQYGDKLAVLVDACQMRSSPATLQGHLQRGCMVAITGSKFLTGPTFSGALLIPAPVGQRLRQHALPSALRTYSCPGDWPDDWPGVKQLPDLGNFGLVLRWQAALYELAQFAMLAPADIERTVHALAQAIQQRLADDAHFLPLALPPTGSGAWDQSPTLFPFVVCDRRGTPLSCAQTAWIYRELWQPHPLPTPAGHLRCQVGQPVHAGYRRQQPCAALRLAIDARLVVTASAQGADRVISDAMAVLDKTAALAVVA